MRTNETEEREVTIEDVAECIRDVTETSIEYNAAAQKYLDDGGYEWGYHGYREAKRKDDALEGLKAKLDSYIDARVAAVLKSILEKQS